MSGLTDGSIIVYQSSESGLLAKLNLPKVHGHGVNVIDATRLTPTKFVIVTGGDDQHIGVQLVESAQSNVT